MIDPIGPRNRVDRRAFLTSAIASSALPAAAARQGAVVEGGKPVRATRLSTEFPGTQFYDEQERAELNEAYETHSLFRFYGSQTPQKVARFEREFASFMGGKYALAVTSGTA